MLKLRINPIVAKDLKSIRDYIALNLEAPENAMGQYNRIAGVILKLDMLPDRFRIIDSEPEHSKGIRRMLVDNYSVFNVIQDEKGFVYPY